MRPYFWYSSGSCHCDPLMLLLMQCGSLLEREFIATLGNLGCVWVVENFLMFGSFIKGGEEKSEAVP